MTCSLTKYKEPSFSYNCLKINSCVFIIEKDKYILNKKEVMNVFKTWLKVTKLYKSPRFKTWFFPNKKWNITLNFIVLVWNAFFMYRDQFLFLQVLSAYVICQICESYHDSIEELNAHYERDHPTGNTSSKVERTEDGKYKCNLCGENFCSKASVSRHHKRKHEKKPESKNKREKPPLPETTSDGKYKCEFCDRAYFRLTHLFRHQRISHGREKQRQYNQGAFQCEFCQKFLTSKTTLRDHLKRKHEILM